MTCFVVLWGVIKFNIRSVVLYFFETLLLLLILKWLACYLRLPLIGILACDMLWLAYFKEVVIFWVLDAFPLSVFFSVCLRTSNGLGMGEFDKSLMCTLFLGHFAPFLGRIMCFMLYNALLCPFYTWIWFFSVFCKFLDHFTPYLTPKWV